VSSNRIHSRVTDGPAKPSLILTHCSRAISVHRRKGSEKAWSRDKLKNLPEFRAKLKEASTSFGKHTLCCNGRLIESSNSMCVTASNKILVVRICTIMKMYTLNPRKQRERAWILELFSNGPKKGDRTCLQKWKKVCRQELAK